MKYFFFAIGMLLVMIPLIHAQLTDGEMVLDFDKNSNELLIMRDLYNIHNTIVCGTVIGKDSDKITQMPETSSHMEGSSYSIKVEKYFKNSSLNATISALGSEDSNGTKQMLPFEIGQIGLFYIDKIDEKIYVLSTDSLKVKTCKSIHLVSPLKQFRSEIQSYEIICKEGLELVIKSSDGSPACVKPETKTKLIERGWKFNSIDVPKNSDLVMPRGDLFSQQPLTIEGLSKDQIVGEKITFTVKFNGTKHECHNYPSLWIENSDHLKMWESNTIVELCDPDTTPTHFENEWKIGDSPLGIPIINSTGYYTLFAEFENDVIQKDFLVKF
jgi:hypothetical protein